MSASQSLQLIYFIPYSHITNTSLHLIQYKQDYTQPTNESAGGEKINQTSRENKDLLHHNRIKHEWCVLTVCICAEAAVGGWFVASVSPIIPPAKLNRVFKWSLIKLYLKKVQTSCDVGFCTNNDKANKTPGWSTDEKTPAAPARPAEADCCE